MEDKDMSRTLFPELEEEVQKLADEYLTDQTVDNYNRYKKAKSLLAEKVLTRRANEGVVMAAIALNEKNHTRPPVNDFEELASVSGMSKDELQVAAAQLKMKLRNVNVKELTIRGIQESYQTGMLTHEETNEALDLLKKMKEATIPKQISGEINVFLDTETDNAL
jgi:chromatin segregation and condensation protein Rec8/ScpA/Scc1 (kleisin family)